MPTKTKIIEQRRDAAWRRLLAETCPVEQARHYEEYLFWVRAIQRIKEHV